MYYQDHSDSIQFKSNYWQNESKWVFSLFLLLMYAQMHVEKHLCSLCHGTTMNKNCKDVEIFNLTKNIWKLSAHKSTIKVLVVIEKLKHFGVRITHLCQMKALHTN